MSFSKSFEFKNFILKLKLCKKYFAEAWHFESDVGWHYNDSMCWRIIFSQLFIYSWKELAARALLVILFRLCVLCVINRRGRTRLVVSNQNASVTSLPVFQWRWIGYWTISEDKLCKKLCIKKEIRFVKYFVHLLLLQKQDEQPASKCLIDNWWFGRFKEKNKIACVENLQMWVRVDRFIRKFKIEKTNPK